MVFEDHEGIDLLDSREALNWAMVDAQSLVDGDWLVGNPGEYDIEVCDSLRHVFAIVHVVAEVH